LRGARLKRSTASTTTSPQSLSASRRRSAIGSAAAPGEQQLRRQRHRLRPAPPLFPQRTPRHRVMLTLTSHGRARKRMHPRRTPGLLIRTLMMLRAPLNIRRHTEKSLGRVAMTPLPQRRRLQRRRQSLQRCADRACRRSRTRRRRCRLTRRRLPRRTRQLTLQPTNHRPTTQQPTGGPRGPRPTTPRRTRQPQRRLGPTASTQSIRQRLSRGPERRRPNRVAHAGHQPPARRM